MFPRVPGSFAERSPEELLELCARWRFTGIVEVAGGGLQGQLRLRAGALESIDLWGAEGDARAALSKVRDGGYVLHQKLPTPEGGMTDDDEVRGVLHERWPIDVIYLCEDIGLSGTLQLRSGLRSILIDFEAGQMTTVQVGSETDAALEEAWGWRTGEYVIHARSILEPAPPSPEASGMRFLRVVEVELGHLLKDAVRERDLTLTIPIPLVTQKRPRHEQTVRVYYVFPQAVVAPPQPEPPPPLPLPPSLPDPVRAAVMEPAASRERVSKAPAPPAGVHPSAPVREPRDWLWVIIGFTLLAGVLILLLRFMP